VRNHLASIHAVALANLDELAAGLAVTTGLPPTVRGIPIRLSVTYHKKARGTVTAECRAAPPGEVADPVDHGALARLRDAEGDVVAEVEAVWRLGPA
jgi:acyl-coenzyme A thioesterase PaaI-like protein